MCNIRALLFLYYLHHGATEESKCIMLLLSSIYNNLVSARTQRTEQNKQHPVSPSLICQPSPSGTREITLSGAPTGGRPLKVRTAIVTQRKTNVRTPHAPTTLLGCGGVPRGGPLPAAPTPHTAPTSRGQGGGWPHRVGGRRFRGASPFQPAPKIPETGRR